MGPGPPAPPKPPPRIFPGNFRQDPTAPPSPASTGPVGVNQHAKSPRNTTPSEVSFNCHQGSIIIVVAQMPPWGPQATGPAQSPKGRTKTAQGKTLGFPSQKANRALRGRPNRWTSPSRLRRDGEPLNPGPCPWLVCHAPLGHPWRPVTRERAAPQIITPRRQAPRRPHRPRRFFAGVKSPRAIASGGHARRRCRRHPSW
jgi:hypothetical protein